MRWWRRGCCYRSSTMSRRFSTCRPGSPAPSCCCWPAASASPWSMRQDAVHETRSTLGHAPASAARAEAAAFAGEGHEPLEGAAPTAEPRKTMRQHAARDEIPELLLSRTSANCDHQRAAPPRPGTSPDARRSRGTTLRARRHGADTRQVGGARRRRRRSLGSLTMPRKRYAARVGVGRRRETTGRVSISGTNVAGAAAARPWPASASYRRGGECGPSS
jgi:hypothetical protein